MRVTFFKGEQIVEKFREGSNPFMDVLGISYDAETRFVTVRFADEEKNGEPQTFTAQMGGSVDRVYIEEEQQ